MYNTIAGKRIVLFGAAFKADTSDTRDPLALLVCRSLLDEHAEVVISDPHALENARIDLGEAAKRVIFEPNPFAAAMGAHAIAVLTEWSIFNQLNYKEIFSSMEKLVFIFDRRNILDQDKLYKICFNIYTSGKSPKIHSIFI